MATVNKDKQKYPLTAVHSDILAGSGSLGQFICSPTTPFVASALTGNNKGKLGYAVKLTSKDGSNAIIGSITVNGVLGDVDALDDATGWLTGEGFVMEVEALTMTAGYAIIILKDSPNKVN